jgi:hypothetical protein
MGEKTGRQATSPAPVKKRPYEAPVLVRWGTLEEMTQHVGAKGPMDGGKNKATRKTR